MGEGQRERERDSPFSGSLSLLHCYYHSLGFVVTARVVDAHSINAQSSIDLIQISDLGKGFCCPQVECVMHI